MEEENKKISMGKKGRAAGKRFELSVRKDLEKAGWFVVKWANQVDLENKKLVPAKSKWNPFLKRAISEGSGFPDFMAYKLSGIGLYEVIGVESKMSKYLDAEEKKKAKWLIENNVFNQILVGYKDEKKRGVIKYDAL